MMTPIEVTVIAIMAFLITAVIWVAVANNRTFKQRIALIHLIFDAPNWFVLQKHLHRVDYAAHLKRILTFRNPYALYSKDIQELLKKDRR